MLNNIEMATLANTLQVPLVVSDILAERGALTDDITYSLHEAISDFQPDSALLAIALGALKISNIYKSASPSMDVLGIEAERIIKEYGPIWLQNAKNETIDNDAVFELLVHTAEDLENIAELLDLNCVFLRAKDPEAASLCDILYVQAQAHTLIAEEFINVASSANANPINTSARGTEFSNNVLQFPAA